FRGEAGVFAPKPATLRIRLATRGHQQESVARRGDINAWCSRHSLLFIKRCQVGCEIVTRFNLVSLSISSLLTLQRVFCVLLPGLLAVVRHVEVVRSLRCDQVDCGFA
ncbi:unnamed protein product, partial [Ectocarpus fasciculatus]